MATAISLDQHRGWSIVGFELNTGESNAFYLISLRSIQKRVFEDVKLVTNDAFFGLCDSPGSRPYHYLKMP